MSLLQHLIAIAVLLSLLQECCFQGGFTVFNPIRFPVGTPFMGILVALAIPIDVPDHDGLFFSYHIEAFYLLPKHNDTLLTYPPIISRRSIDRAKLYESIQRKLDDQGYNGKQCMIRYICEAAEYSTKDTGVFGDILHVILSPSASKRENITADYRKAERNGKKKNCKRYEKLCPTSLLNLYSEIRDLSYKL